MSDWTIDPGSGPRPPASEGGQGIVRFLGQMAVLPAAMFLYSMEMVFRALRQVQSIADRSLEVIDSATPPAPPAPDIPFSGNLPAVQRAAAPVFSTSSSESTTESKEIKTMDTNLADDMVKLVRYTIVTIERDHERILHRGEELVTDNMTDDAFASWMIASYLQSDDYRHKTAADPRHEVPHGQKKYLRVFYEVLGRWPKQDRKYEKRQLEILEGIREAIENRPC